MWYGGTFAIFVTPATHSTRGRYLYALGSNRRVPTIGRREPLRRSPIATISRLVRLVRLAEVYLLFLLRRTLLAKGGHSSFSSDNIHGDNTDGRKHSRDDDSRRNWHHKSRNMRAGAFCG